MILISYFIKTGKSWISAFNCLLQFCLHIEPLELNAATEHDEYARYWVTWKLFLRKYEMKIDLWYWISRRYYKIWDEITHTFPNFNNCTLTHVMPRSQPAVRATALACLVLRRSYVSNSASPVVDWGLQVILKPPHRQRTSLAAAVPPTHRIARRKSHSEGAFNVLAPCLRGTFNVRSPCHRPLGRTAVCVSEPQWHAAGALKAPLTCVARMDISSLPRVFLAR